MMYSMSWGPFLESPGNFSGPKPEFGIKTQRVVAPVQLTKESILFC